MLKHSVGRLALAFLLIAGAGPARAEGDVVKGEQIYHRCQGCHSIDRNRIGPMHKGLFGRPAGSVPGFDYSAAMKNSGMAMVVSVTELTMRSYQPLR